MFRVIIRTISNHLSQNKTFAAINIGGLAILLAPLADWRMNNVINHPAIAKDEYLANLKSADQNYFDLFELKMIAGQKYSPVINGGDVVVNRKMTELLGFNETQDAIEENR